MDCRASYILPGATTKTILRGSKKGAGFRVNGNFSGSAYHTNKNFITCQKKNIRI